MVPALPSLIRMHHQHRGGAQQQAKRPAAARGAGLHGLALSGATQHRSGRRAESHTCSPAAGWLVRICCIADGLVRLLVTASQRVTAVVAQVFLGCPVLPSVSHLLYSLGSEILLRALQLIRIGDCRLREQGSRRNAVETVTGTTSTSTGHAMRLWGTVTSRRARWRRKGIPCTCTGSALKLVGKGSAFCPRGGRAAAARVLLVVLLLCFSSCGRVESRRASPRAPAARSATLSGDESPPFTLAPNSVDDIAWRQRFLSRLVGTRGAPNATAIRHSFSDETPWSEEREAPGIGTNGRMQFLDGAGSIDFPTRDPDAHQSSRRRRISGPRPSNPEEGGEEQPARTQRLDRADSFDFLPSNDGTGLGLRGLVIVSPDGSTHRVAISLQAPNAQGGSGALLRLVSRVSSMLEAQGLYLQHNLPQELLPPPPSPASFSAGPAAFAGNGDGGGDGGEDTQRQDALWESASVEGDVSGLGDVALNAGAGAGGERETEEARNAQYVADMLQSLFTGGGRVGGADRGGFHSQQADAGGVAEARRHRFLEGMAVSEAARSALRRVGGSEGMEEGAAGMTRDRSSFDWQRGRNVPFGAPGGGNLGALAQRDAGRRREASYYRQTTEPRLIAREQGVGDSGHNMAALDEDSSFSREAGG